ncbi:MAG: GNAT family N-acetyltransferase [Candidatus Heimdallarchaeaceae archaeon]
MEEFESFFKASETRIARLGYMIWDIYTCPEIIIIDNLGASFRCSYDLHTTVFGPPNKEILENFNPKGQFSLSFDIEWRDLIEDYFTKFIPMDKSVQNKNINTFVCMELDRENFIPQKVYQSRKLLLEDAKLLDLKRRILFSQGLGGVGIIENNELIGCAFIPHYVQNDRFSFAIIRGVWVSNQNRNRGMGSDLSSKMCEIIFDKGIEKITLWVEETNLPAVRIYEKLKFKIVEKVHGVDCVKK